MVYSKGYAIVGIGCRFPGGINSLDNLWKVLSSGMDVVTSIPEERFDLGRYWHPDRKAPGRTCTTSAGIVGDLTSFDASFFGMSPKEAEALDPQQRMMLEMAWEAFEDAGIPPSSAAGTKTAVYVGAASTDMGMIRSDDLAVTGPYGMTGTSLSIIANRLSYFFDLHGPSMTIDTACSSSLVALNEACRAMENEGLPMALVGGVNVLLSPMPFVGFSKAHMLSEEGRCKVFDAKGDGYVRSEGGAVVLLKPLEDALRDGDAVHAVVRATGVNSDGRTAGIALPNGEAQAKLLHSIYDDPRIERSRIAYVEAHGTGTAAGDPIETKSIGDVLGRKDGDPLWIGSVKSNLGHLETGSGMAGLAKAITVLEKHTIPANLFLSEPNPKIDFEGLGIRVPTQSVPLPNVNGLALVGVNSFGFGGTNAHVLLEESANARADEACCLGSTSESGSDCKLLPLIVSAKSKESLRQLARTWSASLSGVSERVYNCKAAAAATQRDRLTYALFMRPSTVAEAVCWLESYADEERFPEGACAVVDRAVETAARKEEGVTRTAFIYSGNGSQWAGMGRDLLKRDPRFAAALHDVDEEFMPLSGWSIVDYLSKPASEWELERTEIAQPLLFAMQVGMTRVLRDEGISPDAVAGHSVGEVAAAWASGALGLKDAVTVIYERSALQGRMAGSGTMAAVKLSEARLADLLAGYPKVEIAGWNAPDNFTLSGDAAQIEAMRLAVKAEGGLCKILGLPYAFHSSRMAPLEMDVRTTLAELHPQKASTRFVSSVDGEIKEGHEFTADYWWRNIREPVRFEKALETLFNSGVERFVEVGPHGILVGYVRSKAKMLHADVKILSVMQREDGFDEWIHAVTNVAAAWPISALRSLWPTVPRDRTLPRYAWNRKRYWAESTVESAQLFARDPEEHPLLGRSVPQAKNVWKAVFDLRTRSWLAGHEIDDTVLFPAAGFLEVAAEGARRALKPEHALELKNLMILRPVALADAPAKVFSTDIARDGVIHLTTRDELSNDEPVLNLVGRAVCSEAPRPEPIDPQALIAQACAHVEAEPFYESLIQVGLNYQGAFRAIEDAWLLEAEDEGDVVEGTHRILLKLTSRSSEADQDMGLPPALVDGALQGLFLAIKEVRNKVGAGLGADAASAAYLPTWFERSVIWSNGIPTWATVDLQSLTDRSAKAVFTLYAESGEILARLEGVRFLRVHKRDSGVLPTFYSERWYAVDSDRISLFAEDADDEDFSARIARALNDTAGSMEWDSKTTDEAETLLVWAVLSHLYESVSPRDEWVPEETVFAGGALCSAEMEPWAHELVHLMVANGLAEARDGLVRIPSGVECPSYDEIYRTILAVHPTLWPELTAIDAVAQNRVELLTGKRALDDVLPKRATVLRALFERIPKRSLAPLALCRWVREVAESQAGAKAHVRPTILLATRTGSTYANLLARTLPPTTSVTLAVESSVAFERLSAEFSNSSRVKVELIADLLERSGSIAPRFDAVLLPEGLSFAADVSAVLNVLAQTLLPGAPLVLVEEAPNALADFLAGADPAWWTSTGNGSFTGRLAGEEAWLAAFERAGFEARRVDDDRLKLAPRMVIAARAEKSRIQNISRPADQSVGLVCGSSVCSDARKALVGELTAVMARGNDFSTGESGKDPTEAEGRSALYLTELDSSEARDPAHWRSFLERQSSGARLVLMLDAEGAVFPKELFAFCRGAIDADRAGTLPEGLQIVCVTDKVAGLPQAGGDRNRMPSICAEASVGLLRVMANECRALRLSVVSLQDAQPKTLARAAEEILSAGEDGTFDAEKACAQGTCYRRFVETRTLTAAEERGSDEAGCDDGVSQYRTLHFDMPGKLDHLVWKNGIFERELGDEEVEIDVRATGLNFRDVMWAMGLLPEEALENGFSGPTMGLEASGVVRAVGRNVTNVKVGDAVVAFAPACFSTVVRTHSTAVAKKPENLSFAEAASVPVAFFTSWYAIAYLGRARRGESILIHGAAGGAGLAAVQIAAHLGLEVYATAGSEAKRSLLRHLGVRHVYNSRSLSFADEIRRDTAGRGVDLVLNSLAGDGAEKSLGLLAPFGRFLELGKRDFYADSPMFLRPFRRNISYFGIDVDQMLVDRPELAGELFAEILERFAEGAFRPLPLLIFPADEAVEAFSTMQSSAHVGKLVVAYRTPEKESHPSREICSELISGSGRSSGAAEISGTVIISGGLGGLGRKVAQHAAELGARGLVLLSRRGAASDEAAAFIDDLKARFPGLCVVAPACDVAGDADAFVTVLTQELAALPPVSGVVHAAGVLADAMIANLTPEACDAVWEPKVRGGENLLRLMGADAVKKVSSPFFFLFSSATVLLGNPGQANYVAANMALEALAVQAAELGLVSRVVGWGPVGDVGMLQTNPAAKRMLESMLGAPSLDSKDVTAAMDLALAMGSDEALHFFAVDWNHVRELPVVRDARFAGIRALLGEVRADTDSIRDVLAGKTEDEAVAFLTDLVASEVAKLMGIAVSELNTHQPVADLGMDSLMVVELAAALEERLGIKIPAVSLSGGATIRTMADRFWKMLNVTNEGEQALDELAQRHGVELTRDLKEGVLSDVGSSKSVSAR